MWCAPTFFPRGGSLSAVSLLSLSAVSLLSTPWNKKWGVWGMPFNSCAPGSRLKLKHVAPSVVTFWRTLSKAETPNELTRDVSFNGFAPCLEQPTVLKIACWPGCEKKMWPPVALQTSEEQRRTLKRGERQLVGASWQNSYS